MTKFINDDYNNIYQIDIWEWKKRLFTNQQISGMIDAISGCCILKDTLAEW